MESLSLHAFLDRYLREIRHSHRSYWTMLSVINNFRSLVPDKALLALSSPDLHHYVYSRVHAGIGPGTINRELGVISAAINHARYKWGIQLDNPVRYHRVKPPAERLRWLERHEAARLQSEADALCPELGDFIRLSLNTGCRKTELLMLRWSDVDLGRRFIMLRPENTKTNCRRVVPINKGAEQALNNRRAIGASEWVFAKKNGERVKTLNWYFRKAVKSAGLSDFRIHDLRHTFASWLVSEGVELIKVRDLLGHTSIRMTERYAHLMPNRLHDAVKVLDLFVAEG